MGGRHNTHKRKPAPAVAPRPAPALRRTVAPGAVLAIPIHPPARLLSAEVVADRLGLSPGTIRNWVAQGRIEFVKVGNRTRFRESTIARMIADNTFPVIEE